MMEKKTTIFFAGDDALVNFAKTMHKKYLTTFVFGADIYTRSKFSSKFV